MTLFLGMMENGITEIKFYFVLFVLASQLYTSTGCYRDLYLVDELGNDKERKFIILPLTIKA